MAFLPLPAAIMVAALFTSRPRTRIGRRIRLLLGPAPAFVGMAWLTQITAPSAYLEVLRGPRRRAEEAAGGELLYAGDADMTDDLIAALPFDLYRQGYE